MAATWRPPDDFGKPRDPRLVQAVAEGIVAARTRAGLSGEALAQAITVSRPWLDEIEAGTREARIADLEKICSALNLSLFDLLAETERGRQAARRFGLSQD